jgi:hypothetical protein
VPLAERFAAAAPRPDFERAPARAEEAAREERDVAADGFAVADLAVAADFAGADDFPVGLAEAPFAPPDFADADGFAAAAPFAADDFAVVDFALLARFACGERAAAFSPRPPLRLARGAISSASSAAAAARAAAAAAFFFAR